MLSLLSITEDGSTVEVAMVGNEGVVGLPLILRADRMPFRVMVQVTANAISMPGNLLLAEIKRNTQFQVLLQRYGQTPLIYYRVQPLGFDYNYYGQLVSVLRIDYLTLIDHDSGLVTGGDCDIFPGLNELEGMQAHDIDDERSVVLVAAPVYGYYFNQDPMAYSAYSYFTTAHENTLTDKTRYYDFPYNPIPAGLHINLALSLYKHGTYAFNPDYLPIPIILVTIIFVKQTK